ncbi:MAG: FAD-dependent oxidoreductase [Sphingomonadales bacterium]|nr:FAD-dependent oxidoreductase [Sphingomonadales bacterium]
MTDNTVPGMTKRDLLALIGSVAGGTAMYMAMGAFDQAKASSFKPIKLDGDPKGAKVLILGAGVAGMTSAYELSKAGYNVQVLEFNDRFGGRSWTLETGTTFTELGGATQHCEFAPGNYINPGPWRIPWHHHGLIHYCHEFGIELQPFMQVNYNAYVHSTKQFGGQPQRYRHIQADYYGHVGELLAKSVNKGALSDTVTKEDGEILLESLRSWGALDKDFRYVKGRDSSNRRGYDKEPGGGLTAEPIYSEPMSMETVLRSGAWRSIGGNLQWDHLFTIFQPVGGMQRVGDGFGNAVKHLVRLNSKVTKIAQSEHGVTVNYVDTKSGAPMTASADYCICTIPLPILAQIDMNVGPDLAAAIRAVPYSTSCKVGIEFKRRFWEQDDQIYGGISYTDLPNSQISYPSSRYGAKGPGVWLGAYTGGATGYELTALPPAERIARVLEWNSVIHPQAKAEFMNGVAVGWHRVPWTLGCFGSWTEEARAEHYKNLCAMDGRVMLAGEHASYYGGWQEGGITSAIDAIGRLHQKVLAA